MQYRNKIINIQRICFIFHLIHLYFNSRKDWILLIPCLAVILISLSILFVKKYNHTKVIFKIPRSRIIPAPSINTHEQDIEMNDVESTGEVNIEQLPNEDTRSNQPQLQQPLVFNTTKYNKNLVSFSGISILITILLLIIGVSLGARHGTLSQDQGWYIWYVCFCCLPVILPTIYFKRNPNHFIIVMKNLNSS